MVVKVDNQRIVILLLVVIILLLLGITLTNSISKEKSHLEIQNKTVIEGNSLIVKLTDEQGLAISNASVNIKSSDGNGIDEDITTDSEGRAELKLDKEGNYSIECTFDGGGKYSSCSLSDTVKVEKASTKLLNEETSSSSGSRPGLSEDGYSYYPESGPAVDRYGVTREEAIARNMHYVPLEIDGEDIGGYVAYDPVNGGYHT